MRHIIRLFIYPQSDKMIVFSYTDNKRFFQCKTYLYIGSSPNFNSRQTESLSINGRMVQKLFFDKAD